MEELLNNSRVLMDQLPQRSDLNRFQIKRAMDFIELLFRWAKEKEKTFGQYSVGVLKETKVIQVLFTLEDYTCSFWFKKNTMEISSIFQSTMGEKGYKFDSETPEDLIYLLDNSFPEKNG